MGAVTRKPHDVDTLVDVAVRVFLRHGYDGASIDEIAKAAGIVKSGIYHHVSSKEELLERGVRRALDALFAMLDEPAASEGRAAERLRTIVRRTVEIMVDKLPEVALLLRVRGNTAAERAAIQRRRAFDRIVADIIREAIDDGDVRPDLDPHLTARLLFGMTNSVIEWYRPRGGQSVPAIVDTINVIVFDGMAPRRR